LIGNFEDFLPNRVTVLITCALYDVMNNICSHAIRIS